MTNAASFRTPVLYADTFLGVDSHPTDYADVTDVFEAKLSAIAPHASQAQGGYVAIVREWNGFRARQCNAGAGRFAEAYRFEPRFPFSDIRHLPPPPPPLSPLAPL